MPKREPPRHHRRRPRNQPQHRRHPHREVHPRLRPQLHHIHGRRLHLHGPGGPQRLDRACGLWAGPRHQHRELGLEVSGARCPERHRQESPLHTSQRRLTASESRRGPAAAWGS
ncbi:unnamed protein product [Linum tenue]|uniref:Uncharacterized protein n=1 Tax=Linum tenue TaxID=586396 RepID=A0AAV0QSZ6_9ROSI|nr:unnamed protein product [Linum tenue]